MGKSVSLRVPSRITGDELSLAVSFATGVPFEFFYLTIEGHILGENDLLGRFGALPGAHIRMNGRLRGGVRPPSEYIPGQWTCGVCGMEGCWPARTKCYRCPAPRSEAPPSRVHLRDDDINVHGATVETWKGLTTVRLVGPMTRFVVV